MRRILPVLAATLAVAALTAAPAEAATVYFQDTGTLTGWSNYPQKPQKNGVLRIVSSPSYKGGQAIEAQQTYINETGGYHSEVVKANAQSVGTDRYFGQAIYLPANWQWHDQNVTFQQFSRRTPRARGC